MHAFLAGAALAGMGVGGGVLLFAVVWLAVCWWVG